MFQIFKEPLTSIITKIDNTKESMFLMGTKGVGKSTILNYYYAQNNNRVINGTFTYSDNLFFNDQRLNKIYYLALIIKKLILYIKKYYSQIYSRYFLFFDHYNNNLLNHLKDLFIVGNNAKCLIDNKYLDNPYLILNDFFDLALKTIDFENITLIIDNFDVYNDSDETYQKLLYSSLFKRLKVIATISDPNFINDLKRINTLKKDNILLPVTYNRDINFFKELLNNEVYNKYKIKNLSKYISDEVIKEIIVKTNGNIFTIKRIIFKFNEALNKISFKEYNNVLLEITNKIIICDQVIGLNDESKRKLYIA